MRRRLTLTVAAVVAAALVLAGLGTLVLARRAAREQTREELLDQARALAGLAEGLQRGPVLNDLRRSLRLEGAVVVPLPGPRAGASGAAASRLLATELPSGIQLTEADLGLLLAGSAASGWRGDVAYAAAPVVRPRARSAVVLTREQASGLGVALPWFLVSAALALAVAAVAADRLASRFARPVTEAVRAAHRIAGGDLQARVDAGPGAEPELAELAASINTMAADLERAQGLQRQFLLSVSHELRTPLTSVRGFAEAIADGAAPDARRAAEVIEGEARRLERLVGDLLELATLDARRFSLDPRPVDAARVVADTAEGFRPAAEAAGLALAVAAPGSDGGPEGVVAVADPDRLAQVVANLVENALKFASSTIDVSVAREGAHVAVSVADDGPGIAPEDVPHVFDRLFQSTRRPARTAGSGLGLAIVSELAAAMGATVEAASRPGATRMVVRLRASPDASPAPVVSWWSSPSAGSS